MRSLKESNDVNALARPGTQAGAGRRSARDLPAQDARRTRGASPRPRMQRLAGFAAVLAVACLPGLGVAQQSAKAEFDLHAEGEVQIGPDGHVTDYRLQSKLPESVAKIIDSDVRTWEFKPIVIDGQAVLAKTAMHLGMHATPTPDGQNFIVKFTDVRFGAPAAMPSQSRKPRYPEAGITAKVGAKVVLAVRLNDKGDVVEAAVVQTSLDARANSEVQAESFRRVFEQSALAAARDWHYDVTESIGGRKVGTVAFVPVVYSLVGPGIPAAHEGQWKGWLPGPKHDVPWLQQDPLAVNVDDLGNGEAASADSHFHLKTSVVGSTL